MNFKSVYEQYCLVSRENYSLKWFTFTCKKRCYFFRKFFMPFSSGVLICLGNFIESITAPSVKKRESVNYDQLKATYQPVNNSLIIRAAGQSRQKHMKTVIRC